MKQETDGSGRAERAAEDRPAAWLRAAYGKLEGSSIEPRYGDVELFRRVAAEARPYWAHVAAVFVLGLLSLPLALLAPVGLKIAVDSVLGPHPLPGFLRAVVPSAIAESKTAILLLAAGLLVGAAAVIQVLEVSKSLLTTYTGERLVLRLRARVFRHAQRLSLTYHDSKGPTASTYRIQYDASCARNLLLTGLAPLAAAAVTVVGILYVTVEIDWQLALVAVGVTPILAVVAWVYRRRVRARSREVKEFESGALSVVQEVLSSVRLVRAFGQEEREQGRFLDRSSAEVGARLRLAFATATFAGLLAVISAVGTAAVLVVGVRHVESGVITLGELLLVMAYLAQLYGPMRSVFKRAADVQYALVSAERVFSVLDQAPDVPERPDARPLGRARGHVQFLEVSFWYDGGRPAVENLSFEVRPGQRAGIAGPTGAGKSTLFSLLIRFYDPDFGEVRLDGIDLRTYRLADLRNQFAIVLQEPVLLSTSIAENIAYARPDARFDEVRRAATAARAHDFISQLPDGYDTHVGERGALLSGGERQRISLARAFLKDAPILVLDEPTSSVDAGTEAEIMQAMDRLAHGRTTFVISHRTSTLEDCDVRLQLDRGTLVSAPAGTRLTPA